MGVKGWAEEARGENSENPMLADIELIGLMP